MSVNNFWSPESTAFSTSRLLASRVDNFWREASTHSTSRVNDDQSRSQESTAFVATRSLESDVNSFYHLKTSGIGSRQLRRASGFDSFQHRESRTSTSSVSIFVYTSGLRINYYVLLIYVVKCALVLVINRLLSYCLVSSP